MRILFTGASSFTGFAFVQALRTAGHEVVCTFQGASPQGYDPLKTSRVQTLISGGEAAYGVSFGDERFLELVRSRPWDALCHHASDVTNYRSLDFDVVRALGRNTHNLRPTLQALVEAGCRKVVLTGTVFEGGEGAGNDGLPHILPYGLSKALTAQMFQYEAALAGIPLGKFRIPHPFGAGQEPRFVQYLLGKWKAGESAIVSSPDYVRDNIHVDLLALDYADFVQSLTRDARRNPSGIVSDLGAFAQLVASEMRSRLGWECAVALTPQSDFPEPRIRINTDPAKARHPEWDESAGWDALAAEWR